MKDIKEMMEEAKRIYFMDDFRVFMRNLRGFTDDDFKKPIPGVKKRILKSREIDPTVMFERIMKELSSEWKGPSPLPINSKWHHFIVPGVVLASLRNNGYKINDKEIEEGMLRGEKLAGGSCGFMGTCEGGYSVGIIACIVKKTTPLHDSARSEILQLVAATLDDIAKYPRRCCKRSGYMAIQAAVKYLQKNGFHKMPYAGITCKWSSQNKMCFGIKCPFFPKKHRAEDNKKIRMEA